MGDGTLKWNGKEIIEFLNMFRKYECLWNPSCDLYMKRNAKDAAFIELMAEMKSGGLEVSTILQLKKKIKVLRDSYRLELNKVKQSRKSGAGLDDVYKPKLVWFTVADSFWRNSVSGRESTSNLVSSD